MCISEDASLSFRKADFDFSLGFNNFKDTLSSAYLPETY